MRGVYPDSGFISGSLNGRAASSFFFPSVSSSLSMLDFFLVKVWLVS